MLCYLLGTKSRTRMFPIRWIMLMRIRQTVNVFGWMTLRRMRVNNFGTMCWRRSVSMWMMFGKVFVPRRHHLITKRAVNCCGWKRLATCVHLPYANDWFGDGDDGIWCRGSSCGNTNTIWRDATMLGTRTEWISTATSSQPSHQRSAAESRIFWFWSIWSPKWWPRMTAAICVWRIFLWTKWKYNYFSQRWICWSKRKSSLLTQQEFADFLQQKPSISCSAFFQRFRNHFQFDQRSIAFERTRCDTECGSVEYHVRQFQFQIMRHHETSPFAVQRIGHLFNRRFCVIAKQNIKFQT